MSLDAQLTKALSVAGTDEPSDINAVAVNYFVNPAGVLSFGGVTCSSITTASVRGFVPISAESPDLALRLCPVRSSEIMTPNINDTFE